MKRVLIGAALIGLIGGGIATLRPAWLSSLWRGGDSTGTGSIAVQTEPVTRRDLAETVTAGGKIQPMFQVKISPEVSGEIVELPFKEGETVKKGDRIVRLKPDYYAAAQRSASEAYHAAVANRDHTKAILERATFEFTQTRELYGRQLVSQSQLQETKTAYDIAVAQHAAAGHQAEMAKAAVTRADEDLAKTALFAPITGVITRLSSQLGERVVGTATMAGTEIMQIADLNQMEARVDVGEADVVLVQSGQLATIEIDAFRSKKFTGVVTDIANMPNNMSTAPGAAKSQEATKFEVRIRVKEKGPFRPGMSASALIQTRSRSDVLSVPIQSVTTRVPAPSEPAPAATGKPRKPAKPIEVVFVAEGGRAAMVPVVRGISDDSHVEIVKGLKEGQRVVTGSHRAINRDLQDGTSITLAER